MSRATDEDPDPGTVVHLGSNGYEALGEGLQVHLGDFRLARTWVGRVVRESLLGEMRLVQRQRGQC